MEGKRLTPIEVAVDGVPDQPGRVLRRVSGPRQLPHVELSVEVLFFGGEAEYVLETIREFVCMVYVDDVVSAMLAKDIGAETDRGRWHSRSSGPREGRRSISCVL